MPESLLHLALVVKSEGAHAIGYVAGVLAWEYLRSAVVSAVTAGAGTALAAAVNAQAIRARVSRLLEVAATTDGLPQLIKAANAIDPRSAGGVVSTLLGNIPQADKWIRNGGRVTFHIDGSITYIKRGVSIRYNELGYPDFSKYLYKGTDGLSQVKIKLTGNYRSDFAAANAAAGFQATPEGYTWHHHQDIGLMQLVRTDVHESFWHSGGVSLNH